MVGGATLGADRDRLLADASPQEVLRGEEARLGQNQPEKYREREEESDDAFRHFFWLHSLSFTIAKTCFFFIQSSFY